MENAYWHIPTDPRFHLFLDVQLGRTVLHFMVLPFGLNIVQQGFTTMMKSIALALSHLGIKIPRYFDDWLIETLDCLQCKVHMILSLQLRYHRGLLFNLAKSCLTPTQLKLWLGMDWESRTVTIHLSKNTRHRFLPEVCHTLVAQKISSHQWVSLSSLSTMPRQLLQWAGFITAASPSRVIISSQLEEQDRLVPFFLYFCPLLQW